MSSDAAGRELQIARLIYPLYCAVIERFEVEMFPCRDLEEESPAPDPEALNRIRLWFSEAEKHIEVAHIRQYLQGAAVEEVIVRALIFRYLHKPEKAESDRYKLDFLLGHYLAQNMPPDLLNQGDVKLSQVAQVLAPVLGDQTQLGFLEQIEGWVRELQKCEHVQDLIDQQILEKGKRLKSEAGARYFHQAAMTAFTRFNFLARRCLIKLLATDLDEIGQAVSELQSRGLEAIDCRAAQLSATEPVASLRERVKQWRKPFQGKYSEVEWLQQISDLRSLLKDAVKRQAKPAPPAPVPAKAPAPQPKPATAPKSASVPFAEAPKPPTPIAKPAVAPATAAAATAAPAPAPAKPAPPKSSTPSPRPAPPQAPRKSFGALVAEQSKALSPAIERLSGGLKTQAAGLWNRVRESLSEVSAEPAPAPQAASSQNAATPGSGIRPGGMVQPSAQVRDAIRRISEQAATLSADTDATIAITDIQLSLNAREVNAFRRPHDNLSGILQRSVAVRLILMESLKKAAGGDRTNLNAILKFAYSEAAMLQDRVTQARTNKDVDGALQLAACSRSLQSLIEQAEGSVAKAGAQSP